MDLPLCSRLRLFRIAALAAMCLMAGSGLVPAEEAAGPTEKPEPALKYDPEFPDAMVVATVNSEPITVGDVLEPYQQHLKTKVKPELGRARYREVRREWVKRFLPDVIDRKLRIHGLTSNLTAEQQQALDEYLDKEWDKYTIQLRKEQGRSTMQELADDMEREGTSLEKVKRAWREASMAHQFVLLKVDSSYEPTNRELCDYYDKHRANWVSPTQVKWQQIVVRRQKGEESEVAEGRAQALLEVLQDGADFADLARKHSEGPTKALGGSWDWTETDALACRDVGEFLSNGKIGSTSEVIRHKDEFHIVKILERGDARQKSFEEVEDEIRDTLAKAGREHRLREIAQELVDKADIKTVFGDEWVFKHPLLEAPAPASTEANVDREPSLFDGTGTKIFVYRTGHSEVVVRMKVTEGAVDAPARPLFRDPLEESARISKKSPFDEALNRPGPNSIFPESLEDEEEQP